MSRKIDIDIDIYPDGRMDAKNTALYTGYSVKTLATWRSIGKGPRFAKPGRVYYYQSDLDKWLRSNMCGSEPRQII